jgi:HSP20 family molecular chaperone IbpA
LDTVKKKTTVVGIVTLLVGLVVGVGIGIWGVKTSHAGNAPTALSSATVAGTPADQNEPAVTSREWDPFRDMERMHQEIDRAIRKATEEFEFGPSAPLFRPDAGYSSSFDLRDRKDHFEVHAYLPDVNASDVNVKIDNDQVLHFSVTQRHQETKNTNAGAANFTELGSYEQIVTLPEPVNSGAMKIDRKGHEVVVTIPKAKSS